ncbi:hypothetical protein CIHG_10108 [Coccidioides immitis H538.4]|uniref:Uncharacterized protein n=3 Tax=Coccidioides immitis TaxID=5501 RepID=A0A0J8U4Q5_COCIT|nr:hypothetical protein CIRG_00170 [Coccidioides immitis RMSCC 2394]KMU81877.1 hypothetical protein CISG_02893 [Coccidioides immitis RMSCC 3703]KMU92263.1 hypothetical protein CIHG_10108 [Coccidioides immitis H538.4]
MASSVRQICERSFEIRDHIDGRAVTTTSLQNLPELLDPAVADFFADPWPDVSSHGGSDAHQYLVYHPPAVHCATCSNDLEEPKTVLNASSKKVQKKDEKKDNNQDNTIVRGEMLLHSSLGHHP